MKQRYCIISDRRDERLSNKLTELMLSDKPVWIARIGGSDYDTYKFFINMKLF